jgi:hypothetical protein
MRLSKGKKLGKTQKKKKKLYISNLHSAQGGGELGEGISKQGPYLLFINFLIFFFFFEIITANQG